MPKVKGQNKRAPTVNDCCVSVFPQMFMYARIVVVFKDCYAAYVRQFR